MERLTKQNIQNDGTILYSSQYDYRLLRCETNQKLGKLEDLEEQLGMPLLIMFDILKSRENIFCIDGDFVASDKPNSIEHCEDYFKLTYWDDIVTCDFEVATNEFNKTWFLNS